MELLDQLEQSIAASTEMVTQLLVMEDEESSSAETGHGEHKDGLESSKGWKPRKSSNDNTSSSSHVPFKVEVKLEISMFDGQVNI